MSVFSHVAKELSVFSHPCQTQTGNTAQWTIFLNHARNWITSFPVCKQFKRQRGCGGKLLVKTVRRHCVRWNKRRSSLYLFSDILLLLYSDILAQRSLSLHSKHWNQPKTMSDFNSYASFLERRPRVAT